MTTSTQRDWGYAPDYDGYLIATDEMQSVRSLCVIVTGFFGLDLKRDVSIAAHHLRQTEFEERRRDTSEARERLGRPAPSRSRDPVRAEQDDDVAKEGIVPAAHVSVP